MSLAPFVVPFEKCSYCDTCSYT